MATTKKTKKSVAQTAVEEKTENVNSANLAEENATLKKELEDVMKNYKDMQIEMQKLLLTMQSQQLTKGQVNDGVATVGCNIFNGATLSSQSGDISIPIPYREEVEIPYSELREVFKNTFGYKTMFKKGLLYFKDADDYKKFSVKQEIDISDKYLKEMLKSNANAIIERVKEITKDKNDFMEVFALIYQIAYLIDKKEIDLDYEIRSSLEKYFEVDFKTLINNLHQ